MSLMSAGFALFVMITAALYFLFPVKKYQWTVLLAASYVFYLFSGWRFLAYILVTTVTSWGAAIRMEQVSMAAKAVLKEHRDTWDKEQKKEFKGKTGRKTRRVMILTLLLNFGILFVLKYAGFLANAAANRFGFSPVTVRWLLPLGISFYTFQAMGYVIDVYRGEIKAERSLGRFALFVSFFPQLIQGPISKYDQLAGQLLEEHHVDFTRIKYGCELILWGLFKKLVIANRAAIAIKVVTEAPEIYSGTTLGFVVLLYALQLYADFSAGIDIARAVAQMLGIDMIQNFRQPYFATSLTDYWNRWHISLGAWMKNYVFYPIALSKTANRVTKSVKATRFGATKAGAHIATVLPGTVASLIIFLIVGVWHGAGARFLLYGLWNGGIIMLSILLKPVFMWLNRTLRIRVESPEHHVFQIFRTFVLVCIGNITDLADGGRACFIWFRRILCEQQLFRGRTEIVQYLGLSMADYNILVLCTALMYAVGILRERRPQESLRKRLDGHPFITRWAVIFVGILSVLVFGVYGPGFTAAEFAYMQF